MKKFIQSVFMMSALASCFLSCEKMTFPENGEMNEGETNSLLQVRTRTIDEGTEVSFPVNVYVFKGEKCVALQTLTDENHPLSIALTEGDYSVYAIGGASAENYILPSQEDATPSMAIALQAGKSHGDLMAAKSNVTLVDGGTNTLTLALERKVMLLQNVTLNNIPSAATAVSVTISPLWQQLEGTTYTGEEGTTTIALTKQSDEQQLLNIILSQPDVWAANEEVSLSEEEWNTLAAEIGNAVSDLDSTRLHEGEILKADFAKHVDLIEQYLNKIPQYEAERITTAKERMRSMLSDTAIKEVDENRFEQELIYYLEKLDITEEKVRLKKHIDYFRDVMEHEEGSGKKLGFIAQEMGREINTTGSKANHVEIQRLVVAMKDELEKIKEQLGNIL